jgi:hypothetical protein
MLVKKLKQENKLSIKTVFTNLLFTYGVKPAVILSSSFCPMVSCPGFPLVCELKEIKAEGEIFAVQCHFYFGKVFQHMLVIKSLEMGFILSTSNQQHRTW